MLTGSGSYCIYWGFDLLESLLWAR